MHDRWPSRRQLIGLCHRIAYATLMSVLIWIGATIPIGPVKGSDPLLVAVTAADLPIALATQALPCTEFAIDLWFTVHCPPPQEESVPRLFVNHLRVGIPVYVLLFYLPAIVRAALRRRGGTSRGRQPADR